MNRRTGKTFTCTTFALKQQFSTIDAITQRDVTFEDEEGWIQSEH
jgi:hypothetical protein